MKIHLLSKANSAWARLWRVHLEPEGLAGKTVDV